jgi:hypothetical protein
VQRRADLSGDLARAMLLSPGPLILVSRLR